MSEWQPIKTAPKDRWILVCWPPKWPSDEEGDLLHGVVRWMDDEYQWRYEDSSRPPDPTHWMPLVPPPDARERPTQSVI